MLKVIPKAWSYTFAVKEGDRPVAQVVDLSWWRYDGEIRIQDAVYTARRDRTSYVLESTAAGVIARAERPRWWSRKFIIEHSGRRYTLRAKSLLSRQLLLFEGSQRIGSIAPEGLFTTKASVEFPQTLPMFLQVFIIWLAMTVWKGEAGAAAAGGAAALSSGG